MTEIHRLVELIEETTGNVVPQREYQRLGELAQARARATDRASIAAYLNLIRDDPQSREWQLLLTQITIKESYLFRAPQQLRALQEKIIPDLVGRRGEDKRLVVWSAGCARGEEAATLAVVCAQSLDPVGWSWRIVATDVDAAALEDARTGRFSHRAVAKVPREILDRYFVKRRDGFELCVSLQDSIEFCQRNLLQTEQEVTASSYDIVFLRNVLIYFKPAVQRQVVAAVTACLKDDGYLFLGPSESVWQLSRELEAVNCDDCYCCRRRLASRQPASLACHQAPERAASSRGEGTPPSPSWSQPSHRSRTTPPAEDMTKRRYHDSAHAAETGEEPRLLTRMLARIIESLMQGQIDQARELIEDGIKRLPEAASLRALEGYSYDVGKQTDKAFAAYRAALYLDGGLYQIRFLQAQCMERMGWTNRARRVYREVLVSLSSSEVHELEELAVIGFPSRSHVEIGCRRFLRLHAGG